MRKRLGFVYSALRLETEPTGMGRAVYTTSISDTVLIDQSSTLTLNGQV